MAIEYRGIKFPGYNKAIKSNKAGKKKMVLAKEGSTIRLIHFGDAKMGHNYSAVARKSFKARHAKNIKKGKLSAAYWSSKILWSSAKGASKKMPPKSQKHVKGIKRKK